MPLVFIPMSLLLGRGIARKLCRPESGTVEGNRSHFKFPLVLGAMLLLAIALASER